MSWASAPSLTSVQRPHIWHQWLYVQWWHYQFEIAAHFNLATSSSDLLRSASHGLSAVMILSKFRTALCGRRPPVSNYMHFLTNFGSIQRSCSRGLPEPCRFPADLMRLAWPRCHFPNLLSVPLAGDSEKSLRRSCWLLVIPCAAWLQAEMVLSNLRTALCWRRLPVSNYMHFLTNFGSIQ